ncbi:sigma-54-dependent Fis family transcriptional regulator [Candidatus Methylospira mobilis]|uniref:Sigma-54-dependent Fis family transcriptional regulator n=1 Tax=Candidatus Methylospira mobilis TaxID=1808979 RepID=A0A5Q0BH39_9GAMM|nr:sigma-54 dependent transcriptional regulator [Candidatus Methylospira mobilis]QFY41438.1 sigma-54-dependent Fis family transcriptional regulator [Candidatus Methylospira mobilis]WNV05335.1 sigma-54 dependent transcriptional regulator [Candidatus Methylospira mobilis]
MNTLLVIEDEMLLGAEIQRHYRKEGWEVEWATSLHNAREVLSGKDFDPLLILSDMHLPDGNALDLLEEIRQSNTCQEWILLTGMGSVPDSVRALRLGAYDFLEKPCELDRLDLVIASAARSAHAQRRLLEHTQKRHKRYSPEAYVGKSPAAQSVRAMLEKLTRVPFSALIVDGETGTGKGLVTRILHYSGSRAQQPFIELNCAALPRELLESEVFGHEAGAFTGAGSRHRGLLEQADGGTIFLDEIGEMPLDLQAKLLKAIEDRKIRRLGSEKEISVDVQIVAASNRDLEAMSKDGSFRADLYHRLSVFRLSLPPMRDSINDLYDLVPLFIAEFNAKSGRQVRFVPDEVWKKLLAYNWPGNVRELRNLVERSVLFADTQVFPSQWLQLPGVAGGETRIKQTADTANGLESLSIPLDGSMNLEDMDRYIIETALERSGHNVVATARALGATRETLRYRIRKYGIDIPNNRADD